ncbi:precorrin-8X methylmutase [Roseofilum casamattae]|uniref:Precorrin-8X methylmutase n=1 Tax=Roseofilum casamattae BLCC-M143 TaxID=3022442 RepID=A0ABT7BU92_9CYAN|nr:precorrin-8X methylmutase [Roseofilum casamattae]MDJ1182755.1 precorrin-8X methylmutase [Roseofilum casamattae BLCC-M143]
MSQLDHPIVTESFAIIDREIGSHQLDPQEYAIARRIIHSTADFQFKDLLAFSPDGILSGISALQQQTPIVTDVSMVKMGIANRVARTFGNPIVTAIEHATTPDPGRTRTETGMMHLVRQFPQAIFVIGNAPTALLALCEAIANPEVTERSRSQVTERSRGQVQPALIIGAPVGFVAVAEAKARLAETKVPQIRVLGRKGGSPVAAAIVNALIGLAVEQGTP